MHTKLCDTLGIEFPIFAFTHCRDVVAAVSQAGGFGVLGAVGFTAEQLEVECKWIDEHVGDKPYGVDIVIPGKYEGMGELEIRSARLQVVEVTVLAGPNGRMDSTVPWRQVEMVAAIAVGEAPVRSLFAQRIYDIH